MKATSYGAYDVFDDDADLTWEAAERRALEARGKKAPPPSGERPEEERQTPRTTATREVQLPPPEPERSKKLKILDRALILLIHIRERVLNEDPQVVTWINEVLEYARDPKDEIHSEGSD